MTLKTIQRSGVPSGFQRRRLSALLNRLALTALGLGYPEPCGCDQQQGGFWNGGIAVAGRITVPGSQRGSTKSRARSQQGLFSGFKISLSLPGNSSLLPSSFLPFGTGMSIFLPLLPLYCGSNTLPGFTDS